MHYNQVGFIPRTQGWLVCYLKNQSNSPHQQNKGENYTIITINAEKAFDKNSIPIHNKNTLENQEQKETFFFFFLN